MVRDLVIDCHADTLLKKYLFNITQILLPAKPSYHVSKDLLLKGGVDVQVFAIFVPPRLEKIAIEFTLELIHMAKEMEEKESFKLIKSISDIDNLKNSNNTLGMILSMEGALALERKMNILPIFYELGIRNIGLTWSRKNLFAEGTSFQGSSNGEGLSAHGKQLVEEMDKLGMVIDISHLNIKGVSDVARLTSNPFIASHSNAHHICSVNRNLTDNQLMEIASAEGVVGVNFCPEFLRQSKESTIEDVIKHIKYISDLIGVNHVGLGSDFDGIYTTPKGLENVSKMKNIPPILEKEGFSQQDITKIMGGNFERVFIKVWK
jgi:membrane dipeptidase